MQIVYLGYNTDMGFFNSYTKEGKGVNKDEQRPIRPVYFFEVFFRKISKMIPLNLLYLLLTAPIWIAIIIIVNVLMADRGAGALYDGFYTFALAFTFFSFLIGPATAGMTHVFRSFATETPLFIYSEFFENYKKNFKQSFLLTFLTGIFMISFSLTFRMPELAFIRIPSLIFFILILFVNYYAFSIMVMFKMKFIDIIKNSFIFALAKLPLNIFILAIIVALTVLSYFYNLLIGIVLTGLIFYSLCGFMVSFSVYPTIEKYMLDPAIDKKNINDRDFND